MSTLRFLDTVESTNQYLIGLIESEKPVKNTAVACFNQTNGRGQQGNTWHSAPGKNIGYSLVAYPNCLSAGNQFILTQTVALAVKFFLDEFTTNITVKWPNDTYWKDQKIAGTLIESTLTGSHLDYSVIGIGININQLQFPDELPNPVSLKQITGNHYDLKELTVQLHRKISAAMDDLNEKTESDTKQLYLNSLYRREGFHRYRDKDGYFYARINGVDAHGRLLLEREHGTVKSYLLKEVAFV